MCSTAHHNIIAIGFQLALSAWCYSTQCKNCWNAHAYSTRHVTRFNQLVSKLISRFDYQENALRIEFLSPIQHPWTTSSFSFTVTKPPDCR